MVPLDESRPETDRITLIDNVKPAGTGVIRLLDAGAQLTIRDLLTMMIFVSNNTATALIYDKVGGPEAVTKLMASWGLSSIRTDTNADAWFRVLRAAGSAEKFYVAGEHPFGLSSPRDMGKLLEKIKKGDAVNKPASDQMLQIMRGQVYTTRLPRYVSGYAIPHKTGDFLPYVGNDVGILESRGRNIVICVFTAQHFGAGVNLEDAVGRMAELTANYFAARQ
jgi:beta-lactamase class A